MGASSDEKGATPVTCSTDMVQQVEQDGYVISPTCLDEETVQRLGEKLTAASYAKRNLLALPIVRELAASVAVRTLAEAVLGKRCFAVKGTFFNKTQESNWKVAWHQDLTIMVRERKEVAEFGPWTVKEGIAHVQPTAEVLSRILAMRLHHDASEADNGPFAQSLREALCLCAPCFFMRPLPVQSPSQEE